MRRLNRQIADKYLAAANEEVRGMLTKRDIINLCLALPDTYEDYPFDLLTETPDAWTVMRHKGNRKGFAHIYMAGDKPIINLKLNPMDGDFLRQGFESINAAWHMNKEHWSGIDPNGDVPLEMLRALIEKSYELTKPKDK